MTFKLFLNYNHLRKGDNENDADQQTLLTEAGTCQSMIGGFHTTFTCYLTSCIDTIRVLFLVLLS